MSLSNQLIAILNQHGVSKIEYRIQVDTFFDDADISFDEYMILFEDAEWAINELQYFSLSPSPSSLIGFFKKRWSYIQDSPADYFAFPLSPINALCMELAQAIIQERDGSHSLKELLMPENVCKIERQPQSRDPDLLLEDIYKNISNNREDSSLVISTAMLSTQNINILSLNDRNGDTPLFWAANHGDLRVMKKILRWGGHDLLNQRNQLNVNPVHVVANFGHIELLKYLLEEIGNKALFNFLDAQRNTLLHWAARGGQPEVIDWLVEVYGKDILFIYNYNKETALHLTTKTHFSRQTETVNRLIQHGGIRLINQSVHYDYDSALYHAIIYQHPDLAVTLIKQGSRISEACMSIAVRYKLIPVIVTIMLYLKRNNSGWGDHQPVSDYNDALQLLTKPTLEYKPAGDLKTAVINLIIKGALIANSKMALFIKNQGGVSINDLVQNEHMHTHIIQLGFDSVCSLLPLAEQTSDNYWMLYAQGLYRETCQKGPFAYESITRIIKNCIYQLTSTDSRLDSAKRPQVLDLMRSQITVIQNVAAQSYLSRLDAVFLTLPPNLMSNPSVVNRPKTRI